LGPLQATSTRVELVLDGGEGVGDPVELGSELSALLLKTTVLISLEVDKAGDRVFIFGPFFVGSDKGEWEGGSCWMRCDLLNGCGFWGAWDIWHVQW
jgi:hypothetical protein